MFYSEENGINSENEFLTEKFDNEACLGENYNKYKIIMQIIIICLSLFIITTNFHKKIKTQISSTIEPSEPSKSPKLSNSSEVFISSKPSEPAKLSSPSEPEIKKFPIKEIEQEPLVNMYICTHKDFRNDEITNPVYKILCDEKSQLKRNYKLEIIETNKDNILYPKRRGYSEGSKIYPIWKLYKEGKITSKYVGLFHYRRIFPFRNYIPDLNEIFKKYDVIVKERYTHDMTTYKQFDKYHYVNFLDESVDIIKEKYPEYYEDAQKFLSKKWANYCNIFISTREDFIKWGDFIFGVLLELDRRYNLTSDDEIKDLVMKKAKVKKSRWEYQARLEAFLMERIGNIFYDHHWKKRFEIPTVNI